MTDVGYKGCPRCLPDTLGRFPIGWCSTGCHRLARHVAATDQRKARQSDEREAVLARLIRQQEREARQYRVRSISLNRPIRSDGEGAAWVDLLSEEWF